jgi:hypothetical protein
VNRANVSIWSKAETGAKKGLFETYQVHSIPRGGDQAGIGNGVHGSKLLERHRLVHEVNRHELDRSESTVDSTDELVNGRAQVLVLLNVLTRGNSELDEDDLHSQRRGEERMRCQLSRGQAKKKKAGRIETNLSDPFRVLREEDFQSVQLLGNTLDVIQSVYADDDWMCKAKRKGMSGMLWDLPIQSSRLRKAYA